MARKVSIIATRGKAQMKNIITRTYTHVTEIGELDLEVEAGGNVNRIVVNGEYVNDFVDFPVVTVGLRHVQVKPDELPKKAHVQIVPGIMSTTHFGFAVFLTSGALPKGKLLRVKAQYTAFGRVKESITRERGIRRTR